MLMNYFNSSTLKKGDEIRPYYHLVFDFYHVGSVNCFPPAENCLVEIVDSNISVQKSANLNEDKSTLYKIFKDLYAQNNVALFFNNDNWSDLFTGLTDFCANEIVNGNLKLIMVESANNSKAEIFMLVERNVDINNWTKNDVIGAVQIELE